MSFTRNMALAFLSASLAIGTFAVPFLPQSASAQTITTGDIVGRVTDITGAALAGATVTLTSLDTDAIQTVVASQDGSFRFSLLRPGAYAVAIAAKGLSVRAPSVAVNVGQASTLNMKAVPEGASSTVEVTAEAQTLLQAEDANISTTYDTTQLQLLPIPGGDISNIPFTAPGINLSTGAGYGSFTAFGISATSNLFTLNGNDTMDPYNNLNNSGASNLTLGANEVQEVAVVSNGYTGQYGRMAGAQVNFTTRGGTNAFHGNAIYYYNGTVLNANDWFNNNSATPRPHAVSNQWAGSFGGPIIKNKLFGFFDDEGLRYVLPGGGVQYTPSPQFQAAILANLQANNPAAVAYYQKIFGLYNAGPGAPHASAVTTADDPALGCGDFTGTGFGAGAAPCAYKFQNTASSLNTEQLYSIRVDQIIGTKDQINYRYKHDWGVQATGTDPINAAFNANSSQPEWEGQLNETHTFSPTITNNLIASGLYYSAIFGPTNLNASLAKFPTTLLFTDGLGYSNLGGTNYNFPQGRNVAQYQIVDDVSLIRGRNAIKVGVNFRRNNITDFRGGVLTSGETVFNSNTDFFNGLLQSSSASYVRQRFSLAKEAPIATYTLGFYAQDEFAATPGLKVTASLRMDRNANPTCRSKCFSRFVSPFDSIDHTATTPYNSAIKNGLSLAYPAIDPILVQPRLGFAYSPEALGQKTVIRGGLGLFSDLIPAELVDNYLTNSPNITDFRILGGNGTAVPVTPGVVNNGYDVAAASNKAFQAGFASGATLATLKTATNGAFSTPAFNSIVSKLKNPMYLEWNLEAQQAIGSKDVLDVNYVGNYGYNLLLNNSTGNAYAACFAAGTCPGGFAGLPTAQLDTRFKIVTNLTSNGHADYNGVTVSYRHQHSYGLQTGLNYAWSHDLDTGSNGGIQNFFTTASGVWPQYGLQQIDASSSSRLNYGNADYDIRHSFSMNYVWQAPFKFSNPIANVAARGWTLSGTLYSRTGYPFSVFNSKVNGSLLGSRSGGTVLAALLTGKEGSCGNAKSTCLTTSQFASTSTQAPFGFGNQSRNSYRGPMYFDTDMNLGKVTKIGEKVDFKIGANAFNVLNHPNFAGPTNDVTNGSFGTITLTVTPPSSPYGSFTGSAVSGRVLQVMTSISF